MKCALLYSRCSLGRNEYSSRRVVLRMPEATRTLLRHVQVSPLGSSPRKHKKEQNAYSRTMTDLTSVAGSRVGIPCRRYFRLSNPSISFFPANGGAPGGDLCHKGTSGQDSLRALSQGVSRIYSAPVVMYGTVRLQIDEALDRIIYSAKTSSKNSLCRYPVPCFGVQPHS